ncbi:maltose permease [Aspergillus karnatakaensis]|uniref:maltose permease n=1 Tax=Aspergillus karnatakaensis TaxID=1810916 RepID=UPI003CCCA73A
MDVKTNPDHVDDEKLEAAAVGIEHAAAETSAMDKLTIRELLSNHPAVVWWAFYWGMAGVAWGFDSQINGAVLSVESFRRAFGYVQDGEAILPANWQSAFNTVPSVGGFFSAFFCSWLADRIGRKWTMLVGLMFLTGGILGEMFTLVRGGFVAVKILLGCGLGFMLTLGPLTTSEITPVALRGVALSGVNLGIAIGQLLSSAVIRGFGSRTDHWGFQAPFAIQLFFVVFLLAFLPFAPETPWHLIRKGRREDAARSLRRLYGPKANIEAEVTSIERTVLFERESSSHSATWAQCFRGTDLLRTSISLGGFVCQHSAGIIFVLGYSTYFFQLAGLPDTQSFNLGVGVTACGVAGNIVSWFVVNSLGRRTVFLTGMFSLLILLLLIGIMDVIPANGAQWVQAAATVIYNFVYFATIGSMAYTILGETSSAALRAKTSGLAAATQSVLGVAMNFANPYMVNPDEGNLQGKVGFVFGGLCAFACVWSFFYIPELKGRSIDEIDQLFHRKVKPRKMGGYRL